MEIYLYSGRPLQKINTLKRKRAFSLAPGKADPINSAMPSLDVPFIILQEIGKNEEIACQARQYGLKLLEELEKIKRGWLAGNFFDIIQLQNFLKEDFAKRISDPVLHSLIQEIEVRVSVEMAKLDKNLI